MTVLRRLQLSYVAMIISGDMADSVKDLFAELLPVGEFLLGSFKLTTVSEEE